MPNFHYIARSSSGQEVSGVMQADNEQAVVRSLDEQKLLPVQVSQQAQDQARLGGKVRTLDLAVMYSQLADLLRAGVPMMRSLDTLAKAVTNQRLAEVLRAVRDDVAGGKTLADSMTDRPAVFSSLYCAMVRAGEKAGFLEDVLANLGQFLERQDELRSKVRGAMIYPILLTVIGAVLLTGVLVILVPRFKGFFKGMPLPWPTEILFAISGMLENNLPLVIIGLVLIVVAVRLALRSEVGRRIWDVYRLKVPMLGTTIRMVSITRFCRILGTMLANGVPILQSLTISKDAAGCSVLAKSIEDAGESVRAGQSLAQPLKESGLFPPEILEMISVAEESNQMEKVLVQIADTVERRTNRQVDQAVRLIEPLILVFMATMIGFVAVGLLYPIFTMSQTISK
jgi:general secretion pathway protein F